MVSVTTARYSDWYADVSPRSYSTPIAPLDSICCEEYAAGPPLRTSGTAAVNNRA